MGTFRDWVRRRRVLAAFAAGVLLTLAAVAIVGYLVLADQRRSARILAAALTQALGREVEIERVTDLGPSRVVLRGLRLPAERGWPAEVKAESVEASGPLLSAARGEAAPVRLLVTRPKIVAGGGGATGAAALEGLRQGLASFIGSAPLVDVAITGGVIQVPGSASEDVTFDATLHKGSGEVRGEVLLRDRARSRFTLGLYARAEGDTIRLDLAGEGGLAPLAPWLPAALVAAARTTPVDVRAQLGPLAGRPRRGARERAPRRSRGARGRPLVPGQAAPPRRAPGHRRPGARRVDGGPRGPGEGPRGARRRRGHLGAGARRVA